MICSQHLLLYVAGLQKKQGNENGLTKLILRNLQFRHIIMTFFVFFCSANIYSIKRSM